jgi:hypothetical protein
VIAIATVEAEVDRVYPKEKDADGFRAMVLLLASRVVGTQLYDLINYTGYPYDIVLPMWARLRAHGIFGQQEVLVDLFEEAPALGMYANVALGFMKYNPQTRAFSNTAKGNKWVEERINNANAERGD